jgi:hypothetical protein
MVTDLKKDAQGAKEFEDMLLVAEKKKKELQKRIDTNKAWIVSGDRGTRLGYPTHEDVQQCQATSSTHAWLSQRVIVGSWGGTSIA